MKFIKKKLNREQIILTAVFGALWGILELTAGASLNAAKIPMRGIIMALIAAALLPCAKGLTGYNGSLIYIGAVAVSMKALAVGGAFINPLIAMMAEAFIAEIVFQAGRLRLFQSGVAGALILIYTFLHAMFTHFFIFFGLDILKIYENFLAQFSDLTGANIHNPALVLVFLGTLAATAGFASGIFGYRVAEKTKIIIKDKKAMQ